MSPKVEIEFADGERASCDAIDGKSILHCASSAGMRLAYDCKQGQCQTCRLQLRSGRVSYTMRDKLTLTAQQEAEGMVLPCQGVAECDVSLFAPYTRASLLPVKQKNVDVVAVRDAGPGAVEIVCRFGQHSRFEHLAGQYVRLSLPSVTGERSYSMVTCAGDWPNLCFLVRLIPGGLMSSRLACLEPGTKLTLRGPLGSFYLRETHAPMIWVAGGTGLAPFLSMLSALRRAGRTDSAIDLCFGVNSSDDMCWPLQFDEWLAAFPRLKLRMAMVRPPDGWTGTTGSAVDALAELDLAKCARAGSVTYLCGPPPMIAKARQLLADNGFPAGRVFNEAFQPSLQE